MSAFKTDDRLFGVGVLDFAGSLVVHVVGGTAALVACWYIGPRSERFGIGGKVNELPMHCRGVSNVWDDFDVVWLVRI